MLHEISISYCRQYLLSILVGVAAVVIVVVHYSLAFIIIKIRDIHHREFIFFYLILVALVMDSPSLQFIMTSSNTSKDPPRLTSCKNYED